MFGALFGYGDEEGHRQVKNRRDNIELNKMITRSKVIKKII